MESCHDGENAEKILDKMRPNELVSEDCKGGFTFYSVSGYGAVAGHWLVADTVTYTKAVIFCIFNEDSK